MAKAQRSFALIMAILFFATAIGSSVFLVVQLSSNGTNQTAQDIQQQIDAQTALDEVTNKIPQEGQLEGTKLANFTIVTNPVTELQVIDTVEGTGEVVSETSTITAHYTGAVVGSGIIFQSSHDGAGDPFTAPLSGLIVGWQKGIPGMKVGGTRRIIIPAEQAYGASAQPGIPANSDLVFDIELIAVEQ